MKDLYLIYSFHRRKTVFRNHPRIKQKSRLSYIYHFRMYSVPTVPAGLRHEETIIQALNALDCLRKTIHDVFDKIDTRLEKNGTKVKEIQCRINEANRKIDSLVGINKAIKIFSPSKFPASHVFRDIPVTFDTRETKSFLPNNDYEVKSGFDKINSKRIEDKISFFHVRDNNTSHRSKLSEIIDTNRGLGSVPTNISSINSILLFNTDENIYESSRKAADSMFKGSMRSKPNLMQADGSENKIEAPPMSISNRKIGERRLQEGFFYTPKLNDAPEIDVPDDLPDLPGIVEDVHYDYSDHQRIAPSLFIGSTSIISGINNTKQDNISGNKEQINVKDTPINPLSGAQSQTATIDSIPDQSRIVERTNISSSSEPPTPISPAPPPPPPPPPPPATSTMPQNATIPNKGNVDNTNSSVPSTTIATTDARMNLMEAIRKAGGARGGKLRAAAEVVKTKDEDIVEEKKPAGDLMADLHNKLLMRRKGISGAKESGDTGRSTNSNQKLNLMDRMKEIIPPPPKPTVNLSNTDGSESEDDWK